MMNRLSIIISPRALGRSRLAVRSLASLSTTNASTSGKQADWSQTLSYAQAESDFTSSDRFVSNDSSDAPIWSGSMSFASPESDFVSSPMSAIGVVHKAEMLGGWPGPSERAKNYHINDEYLSRDVMVDAPETAFGSVHSGEFQKQSSTIRPKPVDSLSMSPETATGTVLFMEMLDDNLKAALAEQEAAKQSLPKSVADALNDERPIVITSAKPPFQVQDVNRAWEGLCGYSREEAINRPVVDLLQGPQTEKEIAQEMFRYLKSTGFSEGTLTNYKKDGRTFENHLQMGIIFDDDSVSEAHFIGVLEEISNNTSKASSSM